MKKLQLALLLTFAVIILLIIIVFSAPTFINWQNNKGLIENIASDFLGHRVQIKGDLQLQLLPNPKLYAENIVIDSLSGAEKLVEVEHVILTKPLTELLMFNTTVETMVVNRPSFNLIVDESGAKNWEPLSVKNSNYYSRKLKSTLNGLQHFRNITVENARVMYTDLAQDKTIDISSIYLNQEALNNVISIIGSSVYNGEEQKMSVNLDLSNADSARVSGKVLNDAYTVSVQGIISNIYRLSKAQFTGKISSEFEDGNRININETVSFITKKYFDLKQLKLDADFILAKDKLSVSAINVDSKFNKLTGSIDYLKKKENLDITLNLDIEKIYVKKEEQEVEESKPMEWSDTAIDFSFLNNLRLGIALNCADCRYGSQNFQQVNVKASLENSNLIINQFNLKADEDGFIRVSATAGLNSPVAVETKIEASEFPLYMFLPEKVTQRLKVNVGGEANFSTSGVSVKALFSNLTGSVDAELSDVMLRKVNNTSIQKILEGLLFGKHKTSINTVIKEVKINGAIRDGVLRTSDVNFAIGKEEITAKGKLDLANLTMNYRIEPVYLRRKSLGAVVSGNVNDLDVISDKITPKGVVDGFNRIITTKIINKPESQKVKTPFDFDDAENLEKNVKEYLFEN